MADDVLKRDQNHVTVMAGVTNDASAFVTMLQLDPSTKRLLVNATLTGASLFSMVDTTTFTPGATAFVPIGGELNDTSPVLITEGTAGAARLSARREVYVQVRDAAGNERGMRIDANGAVAVTFSANPSVNVGQINGVTPLMGNGVSGTGSLRVNIASDNTAFSVNATLSAETTKVIGVTRTADGSGNLITSTGNALDVNLKTSGLSNLSTNVAQMNGVTVLMGNGVSGTGSQRVNIASDNSALPAWGHGATGSAVPAGATSVGGLAKTALPSAASDGNLTGVMLDKFGRQVVVAGTVRDLIGTTTVTLSASTSETTLIAAVASVFNDLIMLVVSNTSASTATRIDFRDTTAGSVLFSLMSPGSSTIGFSVPGSPIPQTSVNTNWTAQCASSVTDIRIYAVYAKNK